MREQRYARTLSLAFWRTGGGFSHHQEGLERLAQHPAVRAEFVAVLYLVQERSTEPTAPCRPGWRT